MGMGVLSMKHLLDDECSMLRLQGRSGLCVREEMLLASLMSPQRQRFLGNKRRAPDVVPLLYDTFKSS